MSDIFISYKREDQLEAKTLAAALERENWTVWWDPQLRAGERFDEVIERELNNAKCVIVLWSHRSIQSQYVKDEATYALNLKKLIPVAIDEVSPPFRFQGLHTLFFSGWGGSASAPVFRKLLVDIENIMGRPSAKEEHAQLTKRNAPQQARHEEMTHDAPIAEQSGADEDGDEVSTFGATAIYGEAFKETQVRDIYLLRVHVNLLSRASDADHRAKKEIGNFLKNKSYSAYEIVNRRHNFLSGYYEYTVRFRSE